MIKLNKKSQLAIIDPEMTVTEYEKKLNDEDLTGGYRPIAGNQITFEEALRTRISNMYCLKYGGIEDLCAGGVVELPGGKQFAIRNAPRSATGSDLKKVIVGADDFFGRFHEVTLRVFPIPEARLWGLALFEIPQQAARFLQKMTGLFIRPLFLRLMDEEEGCGLLRSLNLKEEEKVIAAFKLTGLRGMVDAEKETLLKAYEGERVFFYWPSKAAELDILDETLMTPEAWRFLMEKMVPLLGGPAGVGEIMADREIKKFIRNNPIT